jgi:hypothetical protein
MSVGDAPSAETGGGIDAFISYRRSDGTQAARRIRAMLQNYRLPRALRAGHRPRLTVFLDTAYERGAADFYEQTIRPALLSSRWLVVVATPDAVRRTTGEDWISREVADFSAGPNAGNVVVVRALGEFMDELPADIAARYPNVQIVDLREEGLLSRISPQRNARLADEQLKLVGPLFDVKLEDMPRLRREEEKRQMGRLGALAGVASATLVLVGGLSVFALRSQWEGTQAIGESLRSARATIVRIVAQLSADEPLDSPIHEAVLEACDVATRLTALSNATPDADASLACALEEARAVGFAGSGADARETIRTALEREDARGVAGGGGDRFTPDIVRTGYRFWTALADRDGIRDGVARTAWASFERRRSSALVADPQAAGIEENDLRLAIMANRAAWEVVRAAGDEHLAAGGRDRARAAYLDAAGDARRGFDLVDALNLVLPGNSEVEGGWLTNAERALLAASDIAGMGQRGDAEAMAVFRDLLPYFELDAPNGLGDHIARQTWRSAALSGMLIVSAVDPDADGLPPELWECLTLTQAALKGLPESDPDNEYLRNYALNAADGCMAYSDEVVDSLRKEIERLTDAGDTAQAAFRLAQLVDDGDRLISLHEARSPWDHLYYFVALRDLAALHQQMGEIETAEATRLRALAIVQKYLGDLDAIEERAPLVADVKRAWDDIWNGHYNDYLDMLRASAATQPPAEAIATLRRIIAADTAWDAQMPVLRQWDIVWRAGIMLQLADLLVTSDPAAYAATLSAAYDLVAPLNGSFADLGGGELEEANSVWSRLTAWKKEAA